MTASDILKIYRKAAPALGYHASAWVALLTLCEAGDAGMSLSDLTAHHAVRGQGTQTVLRRWVLAGLATVTERRASGTLGGRPCKVYTATPKLYKLLRLDQPTRAAGEH